MRIAILSDTGSWKNTPIARWTEDLAHAGHQVVCLHEAEKTPAGDVLFILGCCQIVPQDMLKRNKNNIVVHESALPKGRGWSPMTWQVLEGAKEIPLTLFEAAARVDAGKIYLRGRVSLAGDELLPEIRAKVAAEMIRLCREFIASYPEILKHGVDQEGEATYYPKRNPEHSRLDPKRSIEEQFDLLRVADNRAYPALLAIRGATYVVKIERQRE